MKKNTNITGHLIGGIGHNLIYALMAGYISIFFTDVFGIDGSFVATLFLIARFWDAINDPIMGSICDKTKSKHGHFRSWIIYASPFLAVFLVLCFTKVNVSGTLAKVYASCIYILLGMSFTALDISYWGLPSAMTTDSTNRTKIYTIAGIVSTLTSGVAAILIPALIGLFGNDQAKGYFVTALSIAIIAFVLYYICFKLTKELPLERKSVSFKESSKAIYQNKPLLIIMVTSLFGNIAFQLKIALNAYYATYSIGNFEAAILLSAMLLPGMIVGGILAPILSKKFGSKTTLFIINSFGAVMAISSYFVGYDNLSMILVFMALFAISLGSFAVLINSMFADTIDYAELLLNNRYEGSITSTRTFITKLATALAGSIPLYIMTSLGFVAGNTQNIVLNNAIHIMFTLVPGICFVISLIPLVFYPLDKKSFEEMEEKLKIKREKNK